MKHKKFIKIIPLFLPALLLGEVTILDSIKIEEKTEKKTNSIEIDLEKIEQTQANSLFDLFKKASSTQVGGAASNTQRIYLRGVESSNLNISLDGAKQGKNIFQHRGNELGVNPDLLKVVDVKTSPDASKGGALGGSIQMSTKDAQDFAKNDKTKGVILKTGYNTNSNTKLGSATAYQVIDKNFGIYTNISGLNNDNYKDGKNNEVYGTAYKDRDYLLKFSMLDVKEQDLKITINQNENSGDFQWGRLGSDTGIHDPNGSNPLEKIISTTTNYTIQHNYNPSNLINLDSDLNLTKVEVDRKTNKKKYENENIGLKVQNHFDFDISNTKNRVSIGTELQNEDTKGSFDPNALDVAITKYAPTSSQNKALFIQNQTTINDLNIYYGLRFDDYEFETGLGKAKDNTFSPNIGFDYALTPNSLVYANYGKSSRMSGIIPFTWLTNIKKDTTYSKDLEAEKSARYEVGYKYTKQNTFVNDDYIGFDINIFKTNIKDLIVSKDVRCVAGVCGSGEGGRTLQDIYNSSNEFESKGFEIKTIYNYDIFTTSLSYTKIDASDITDNSTGYVGVNEQSSIRRIGAYDSKKFVWNTGIELTNSLFVDYSLNAIKGIDNEFLKRAGYVTHDVSMKYKPSISSSWTYFAAVNNLTDKYYGSHSTIAATNNADSYRREMGRDFRISAKYEF